MTLKTLLTAMAAAVFCTAAPAQIMSFEDSAALENFSIDKGKLSVSSQKYKLGHKALKIRWKSGAEVRISHPDGIDKASRARNGGMNAWIYNEIPANDTLTFFFLNGKGRELCRLPFCMNFEGWRCIWINFRADLGKADRETIETVVMHFPESIAKGTAYVDMLEFPETVSWQNMSDAQYRVNRTDFSLIPDFMRFRNADRTETAPVRKDGLAECRIAYVYEYTLHYLRKRATNIVTISVSSCMRLLLF